MSYVTALESRALRQAVDGSRPSGVVARRPVAPAMAAASLPDSWQQTAVLADRPFGLPDVLGNHWRFMVAGHVFAHAIDLREDGAIDGHAHPNEAAWGIDEDGMVLLSSDGRVSTRFDRVERDGDTIRLVGRFVLDDDGAEHVLESTALTVAQARALPELVGFDGRELRVRASARVLEVLDRRRISFGRHAGRLQPDQTLVIGVDTRLEPYAGFPVGTTLNTMGAFSYAESELPLGMEVGRYCSIAMGLQVFLDRHPIEWATTSSVTYDFAGHDGYRACVAAHEGFNDSFDATPPARRFDALPTIGHDVWIGQNVQLARGIHIGTGAVIAAGSVVTHDVAPYSIVGGVPARVIRQRFDAPLVERLLASRWWEYDVSILKRCDYRDPETFVGQVEAENRAGAARYTPETIDALSLLRDLTEQD